MSALALVRKLEQAGYSLSVKGGRLIVAGNEALPSVLRKAIRQNKPGLMAALGGDAHPNTYKKSVFKIGEVAVGTAVGAASFRKLPLIPLIPLAATDDATSWRERLDAHRDRRRAGDYTDDIAERLAIAEVLDEMRKTLVAETPPDENLCAGCGGRFDSAVINLDDDGVIDLGNGSAVHGDQQLVCLRQYGAAWRKRAVERLEGIGISVPADLATPN